jgi:large subunit ribosomal protein L25
MEQVELRAESRALTGKHVKRLRVQGYVPAVVYGSHAEATSIQVESKALHKALAQAGGNTLIALQIGNDQPILTLAREVQRDTIRHHVLHVDFYQVVMTEKISAEIPVVLVGESPAVKEKDGVLVHGLNSVEVECLPADLPSSIQVDLSSLTDYNNLVSVADLPVPPSVTILSDPGSVVVRIEAPRLLEEELEERMEAAETPMEPELARRRREEVEETQKGEEE